MAERFEFWNVQQLRQYLQSRLVSTSKHNKRKLIELAKYAHELKLDVLEQDDYQDLCYERRKISLKDGSVEIVPDISTIESWESNLKEIPNIDIVDIMIYLLNVCEWTVDRLRRYKQDNSYQLFKENHITDVQYCKTICDHFYITGKCVPETKQADNPYMTWTLVDSTGCIKSSGCKCVADDGSCKHVVALLFSLNSFCERHVDRHTHVGTDAQCSWDKARAESRPVQIDDLKYYSNKTDLKHTFTPVRQKDSHLSKRELEVQVYNLCKGTSAGFLHTVDPPSNESSSEEEEELKYFEDVVKEAKASSLNNQDFMNIIKETYDDEHINNIEKNTVGQSENTQWKKHRNYRVTASGVYRVIHCKLDNLSKDHYLVKEFFGTNITFHTPHTDFGIQMEQVARSQYFNIFKKTHKTPEVRECGLFVSKDYPFIGASPDGIIKCKCCGERLLEIKCSSKYQHLKPIEGADLNTYHVYNDNGEVKVKRTSSWYYQMQMQMGVCNKNQCDLVFFTRKGISVETIYFDVEIYREIVDSCQLFFETVINKFID